MKAFSLVVRSFVNKYKTTLVMITKYHLCPVINLHEQAKSIEVFARKTCYYDGGGE